MQKTEIIPLLLVGANCLISYLGFKQRIFFDRYSFRIGSIVKNREYYRLFTSGFLHVNIPHLLFNMLALYSFAAGLYPLLGAGRFLILYSGALLGGSLLSLVMHRKEDYYTAAGASGAVSGVIFAGILLFPQSQIMLFLIPIPLPGWLFGIAYILFSIFGMKKQWGNIGHDAHLGGALSGLILAAVFFPQALSIRPLLFSILTLLPAVFLLYEWFSRRPAALHTRKQKKTQVSPAEEVWMENMLERISAEGIGSVSDREKKKMHRISKKKRQG